MTWKGTAIVALSCAMLAGAFGCSAPSDPQNGGALVVGRVKDAVGLDPSHETDGMSLNITSEVFRNLVKFKPGTFDVVPDLASSWTTSPDGKTYTFHLRDGLKFSDGSPLDAKAVVFNFNRWRLRNDPHHGNYDYGYYVTEFGGYPGLIADVQAVSARDVRFTLQAPF